MPDVKLNSIDDYFRFLNTKFGEWAPERRLALAAGMAERWLHVYDSFSAEALWGDPDNLHRSLEAAWNHLAGKTLAPTELARLMGLVKESTPHMDDFDHVPALAACIMVGEALACCRSEDNTAPAIQAVLSGFEAVLPDWDMELETQPRLWKQIIVRSEFEKQLKLIEEIEGIARFDDATIQTLRKKLGDEAYQGAAAPTTKPPTEPVTVTNQWAFERYRSIIELDIQSNEDEWREEHPPGSTLWAVMLFSAWSGRYGRRRQILDGEYGQLADKAGIRALKERNRSFDRAVAGIPDWGPELHEMIGMILQNPHNGLDVAAIEQPHSYGPSFRRLWIEGADAVPPGQEPWQTILDWVSQRPSAWQREDERKKQGLAYHDPELGARLAGEITWHLTGEPEYPWAADVDGAAYQIRLNDFPDDILYSLMINGEPHGDFHDWPETWKRM
jgi:uncharacterized protein YjaG (DUF416 family)